MRTILVALAAIFAITGFALAQDAAPPGAAPQWFLDEIAILTSGTGRWITDNSEYKSDQEPYEQYGVEWKSSFNGMTMTGRLFAVKDGEEFANFWEFRHYWRPDRKEAVIEQFGWAGLSAWGR